jgi:predicted small metal-binding protein
MTLKLRCADLGLACSGSVKAATEDELRTKVSAHARDAHGVELNETLIDYALANAKVTGKQS